MTETTEILNAETEPAKSRVPNGVRTNQVWDFLMREHVGPEFNFTIEHAGQLSKQTGMRATETYRSLRSLENKGLIKCVHLGYKRGMLVTFIQKSKGKKSAPINEQPKGAKHVKPRSLKEVRLEIEAEIADLKKAIAEKEVFLTQLNSYMGKE